MTETGFCLSDEDRRLLLAHYAFYRALDTGAGPAFSEAQQRFIAVCRGTAPPVTAHEHAYANLKDFLRATDVAEADMVSSGFSLVVPCGDASHAGSTVPTASCWTEQALSKLTPRKRAILKLRLGCLPLSEVELSKVLEEKRAEAAAVRPRSLREVARLIGVSKERIRQIEGRSMEKLRD